ncbi:threonine/serine exporter family protein [Rhodococcus aerolatus]
MTDRSPSRGSVEQWAAAARRARPRGRGPQGGPATPPAGAASPSGMIPAAPFAVRPDERLADDAHVTQVLELGLRVGEVLLSSGTGSSDCIAGIVAVCGAYGLPHVEVDVTFTCITVSAHRGLQHTPVSAMRVVRYRSMDYTRLAEVDRLVRSSQLGHLSPAEAHAELDRLTRAPHPYPRRVATLAWATMAAAVSVLLGGGVLVAVVAFLTTGAIDRVGRVVNRTGLPFFFVRVLGAFIATVPAALLYAVQDRIGVDVAPSQIVGAGIIVLLSGLSLVGSVQDAITGSLVTAAGRFLEVVVLTAGIIVGIALALKLASGLGIELPALGTAPQSFARLPVQVVAAAAAAAAFSLASYAERKAVLSAAVAGGAGYLLYGLGTRFGVGIVLSTAVAALVVGLAGGVISRRTRIPPLVIAVAGITPLLPGGAIYRAMYALTSNDLATGSAELAGALATAAALASGVVLGEWFALPVRQGLSRLERRVTGPPLAGPADVRPGGS